MPVQLTISGRAIGRVLLGILIGAALGGLVWLGMLLFGSDDGFGEGVDPERWQAVSLSSGQLFFGHLVEAGDDFYELQDAYFIQETPPAEEGAAPGQEVRPITQQLHQPEQSMLLAKEFVVRVENLRPDSDVAEAIERVAGAGQE